MKKLFLLVPALMLAISLPAEEAEEEIVFDEEPGCESEDFCAPGEEELEEDSDISYCRRYRCRTGRRNFYRYGNRDIDATWPSKNDNSFLEAMMQ